MLPMPFRKVIGSVQEKFNYDFSQFLVNSKKFEQNYYQRRAEKI
jgi:hypothetical protein